MLIRLQRYDIFCRYANKMAFFRHFLFRERARVRQLKRTELARRVESAQCLRSPHSLTKLAGAPIDSYCLVDAAERLWDMGEETIRERQRAYFVSEANHFREQSGPIS